MTKASLVCSQHIENRSGVPEQACHAAATSHFERLLLLSSEGERVPSGDMLMIACSRSVELFCWHQPISGAAMLLMSMLCLSQRVLQHAAIQLASACGCKLALQNDFCLHQPACLHIYISP